MFASPRSLIELLPRVLWVALADLACTRARARFALA
jgi:hypothetical protein